MWIYSFIFIGLSFHHPDSDAFLVSQMVRVVGNLQNKEWQAKWEHNSNHKLNLNTLEGETYWYRPVSNATCALKGLTHLMYLPVLIHKSYYTYIYVNCNVQLCQYES
jgi:hypothetical protein